MVNGLLHKAELIFSVWLTFAEEMNILILAKDYPPLHSIGAKRPAAWLRYLEEMGHHVTVVTSTAGPEAEGVVRVPVDVDTGQKGLKFLTRKLRSACEVFLPFLFPSLSRLAAVETKADTELSESRFDIIIASGEPFVLFAFASRLSKRHDIPWIADYRDNWSNNALWSGSGLFVRTFLLPFYRWAEPRLVTSASALIAAAPSYAERLHSVYRRGERIFTVYNGHDCDFEVPGPPDSGPLKLGFSGRVYPFQDFGPLFRALTRFRNDHRDARLELHFFGLADFDRQVWDVRARGEGLEDIMCFYPAREYRSYMESLSRCHIHLLPAKRGNGWLNAKVFDYLALNATIFLFPGGDGALDLMLANDPGTVTADSEDELYEALSRLYRDFEAGNLPHYNRQSAVYSRQASARVLDEILKKELK